MEKKPKILQVGLMVNPSDPTHGFKVALQRVSSEYRELTLLSARTFLKQIIDEFQPDIVFVQSQQPEAITREQFDYMAQAGCFVINWNGDVRDGTPSWMFDVGQRIVSAFSNMRDVYNMREAGFTAEYLEIGYDPAIYRPEGPIIRTMPIVFFGNNPDSNRFPLSGYRAQMCQRLRQRFWGNFGEYGYGPHAIGNFNGSQADEAAGYRFAKIAINCSHFEIEKYTSDRMYRILGTGTAICLAKLYPGATDIFTDGVNLRFWRDGEELESLIHYYLNPSNDLERRTIVEGGLKLAREQFTFDSMAENIVKLYLKYTHE